MPIPILNPHKLWEQVEPMEQAGLNSGTASWPDEVLVPDVRNDFTPAQMVDQKLEAVLGSHYQGISHQLTGRLGNIRWAAGQ